MAWRSEWSTPSPMQPESSTSETHTSAGCSGRALPAPSPSVHSSLASPTRSCVEMRFHTRHERTQLARSVAAHVAASAACISTHSTCVAPAAPAISASSAAPLPMSSTVHEPRAAAHARTAAHTCARRERRDQCDGGHGGWRERRAEEW